MATASKAKKKTVRLASGRKRVRQDEKINAANTSLRSKFRTVVKNVQKALDKAAAGGDKQAPAQLFKTAQSVIDSVADKGIFHKNKAARHKSRLAAKIKALATSQSAAA
jgi:small subunit ribosomal protein S20